MSTAIPNHPRRLRVAVLTGVGYSVVLGGCAVALGYPPGPAGAADTAGVAVRGAGAALSAGLAATAWSRGVRSPALLVAGLLAVSIAAELVSPATQVIVAEDRFTWGTPWLAGYAAAWPALLLAVAGAAIAEWRLRGGGLPELGTPGERPPAPRPAWGSVLRWALAAGGFAGAAVVVTPGFVGAVPPLLLLWGVFGHALGFAVAAVLLARSGLVTPAVVLLLGFLLAAVESRVVALGVPGGTYLALWPGYLAVALVSGALEATARRAARRLWRAGSHSRRTAPAAVGGQGAIPPGPG